MVPAQPHAILLLVSRGKSFRLGLSKVISVVGSAPDADVRVELPGVSRRHLRITREALGRYVVEDLGSANGTFLARGEPAEQIEESKLAEETRLMQGDVLRVGSYRFHFTRCAEVAEGETPILQSADWRVRLPQVCVVGRSDAGIVIADPQVAIRHATLETFAPDCVYVIDHAGGEATQRNGVQVVEVQALHDGDVVAFAGHAFTLGHVGAGAQTTPLAPGLTRHLARALTYDARHQQVVEVGTEVASAPTAKKTWRTGLTQVTDFLLSRKSVLAAKIAAGVVTTLLLAYPYRMIIECECRVAASAVQKIRAPVSGRIQAVYVKEGDKVRNNEVLLRVVDRALQLEKSRVDKELASAKDAVERMTTDDRRFRMAQIYARRDRAERESERVEALLDQSDVRSGIAGRLMTPTPETLANTSVSLGQELLEVASTSPVYVEALVPETEMDEIVIGQRIRANFYTEMSRVHDGQMQAIAPVAEKGLLGSFIVVKAPLDNGDDRLIPGTTGVARIIGRRHPGIVLLAKRLARTFR